MSEEKDHEILKEWRKERKMTIAEFRRLAESLEVVHRDKAKVEKRTATMSLLADIVGLAGVVLAPVSAGTSLTATAVTTGSTIGSILYRWNANKKDKETSEQIQQYLEHLLKKDKDALARLDVLDRIIEYLKEQLHILKIYEIAPSLHVMFALPSESNTTDNKMTFTPTVEFLSIVNSQDTVNTVEASNVVRTATIVNDAKLFLQPMSEASGAVLTTTHIVNAVKDVSRTVTYTKECSDVLQASAIEGKVVVNQVMGMSAVALFKDVKDISETVTESSDTIRTVTKMMKDAKYAKETSDTVSKAAKIVLEVKDISETLSETSETVRTVTKVVKEAKDMTKTVKSVKDTTNIVKASTNIVKKVNDISDAVTGLKETTDAVNAATKVIIDVNEISEKAKSAKKVSDAFKMAANRIKDMKEMQETVIVAKGTSNIVSTANVVKEIKGMSEPVKSVTEGSNIVQTAVKVATKVSGMTGKVQSAKETSDTVSKAAKIVLEVKDISETLTETSETVRAVTKVVKEAKDMTKTVKSVKDSTNIVKASTNIVKKVNDISDAVVGLKETTYVAKAATKTVKDIKDISETVKSTKEASNTLRTATKVIREVKDASGGIKKMKETSDGMNTVVKVIKDVESISGTVASVKETSDTVKTATTLAKELKGVSETAKSIQKSSAVVETISQVAIKGTADVVKDVKKISETVRNTKETSHVVKTATKVTKDVGDAVASTKQVTISASKTGKAMSTLKTAVTGTESSVQTLSSLKEASDTVKTASKVAKDSTSAVQTTKSAGGAGAVSKSAASVSKFGLAMSAVCIPLDIYNLYQANKGLSQSYEDVDKRRKEGQDFQKKMDNTTTNFRKECDNFQNVFHLLCKQYKDHPIEEVYEYLLLLHDKLGLEKIPRLPGERVWTESMQNMTVLKNHSLNRGTKQFCMEMFSSEIFTPLYWTSFHSNKSVKQWQISEEAQPAEILVDVDDQTFRAVKTLVQSTWEPSKVGIGHDAKGLRELNMTALKVKRVQRIENITLYGQYCQRRQEVFYKAAKEFESGIPRNKKTMTEEYLNYQWKGRLYEEVNEGYFFHGTRSDVVANVLKQGLDPRMSYGGSVIGQGIYMAESSTKADQYTDEITNRQTEGLQVFLVRACLGNICTLKNPKNLKRPPCCIVDCLSDTCGHENRHDSVVLEKFIFREFVAFERPLIYPEYLITYDRVA